MEIYLKCKAHNGTDERSTTFTIPITRPEEMFDEVVMMAKTKLSNNFLNSLGEGWELDSAEFVPADEFCQDFYGRKETDNKIYSIFFEAVTAEQTDDGFKFRTISLCTFKLNKYPPLLSPEFKAGIATKIAEQIHSRNPACNIYTVREISQNEFVEKMHEAEKRWQDWGTDDEDEEEEDE